MEDRSIYKDEKNGFIFRVMSVKVMKGEDGKPVARMEVAYDLSENPETTVYLRRAYRAKSYGTWPCFLVYVNGLEVKVKLDGRSNPRDPRWNVTEIEKSYETKGVKRHSTGMGTKAHQDSQKAPAEETSTPAEKCDQNVTIEPQTGNEVRHEKYDAIKACLKAGIPVYLAGPAGSGKNYTVEQICRELGWKFFFSNSIQQEYKLTGFIDAGGSYHTTEFYKACTSDEDCVFFLDEIDASIPEVLVLLNAAIANGYFEFPEGRVDLDKVHFVAAGNTVGSGADDLYTGRMVIDQATLDRFAIIEFGYDERVEMSLAGNDRDLVRFIHKLRKSAEDHGIRATFSYRAIMMVVKLRKTGGLDMVSIMKIAVLKGLDRDTVKQLVAGAELNACSDKWSRAAVEAAA